ncbi:unnamed protein product [Brassicogethes aeneus]|uniref:Uncharacterized protein n=1 Tax=Brassicogethes aeneus TaxID=1431903 RepID=A0A9P0FF60_BRAAE|nr:unnamed protein product [Brassicogethes aeneus]
MPNKKRLNRERFEQDHSESECSDSNEGQIIRKKKKRIEKSFRKVWQDSWLKQYPWAQKIEGNPTKLKCTCCSHGKYGDKIINCGASELEKHNAGKKHQKFAAALKNTQTLEAFSRQEEDPEVQKVKVFEIKLSAFFAEHNVATSLIDPLIELLKNNITDSKIIKKVTLKRTKCTQFQSNKILIHSLYDNCMTLIKEVLSNFIKTKVIETESCLTINVKNPAFFLTTDKVFVEQECEEILIQLSTAENETFKVTCIKFYQKAAEEIQKRFLLFRNYEFLKTLKFLDPQIALGGEERNKYLPQLAKIAEQFKNNVKDVDFSEIEYEWKKLPLFLSEEAKEKMLQMEVDEF